MNLLLDLGNSRLKWALGDRFGHWLAQGVWENSTVANELERGWSALTPPDAVWMVSVGSDESRVIIETWIAKHWSLKICHFRTGRRCRSLRNGYLSPEELGSDRWAAMIGARELVDRAVCVVDCGTAVTVDAVSDDGEFRGGSILPGLAMSRAALVAGTAGIAGGAVVQAASPLGRDTATAVTAGTLYGLAGAIDRLLDEFAAGLGDPEILVTGGDADSVAPLLRHRVRIVPDLVLRGLAVAVEPAE